MLSSISKPETKPYTLHLGDCLLVLPSLPDNSVDAVVTDPPYGLSFMGKNWDHGVPGEQFWREVLRVAKPGAHLLAFGGTRTYHRLACAIEDAGWEVRDCLMWCHGQGFPKSHDVSRAIDKAAGAEREVIGSKLGRPGMAKDGSNQSFDGSPNTYGSGRILPSDITAPATDAARQWSGWGTALKPAYEPVIVARKPLVGTVAENVLKHGTGAINVDGCRIGNGDDRISGGTSGGSDGAVGEWGYSSGFERPSGGRWPANVIHDGSDEVVGLFPVTASGGFREGTIQQPRTFNVAKGIEAERVREARAPDSGSAARFFQACPDTDPEDAQARLVYCAKASKRDRDEGCELSSQWLDSLELICDNGSTYVLSEVLLWENQDRSQSMVWSGEALPLRDISGDTTSRQDGSDSPMLSNGNCTTELSLTAIRYITSTGTRQTIESKTLNWLMLLPTSEYTADVIRTLAEYGLSPVESAALQSLLKRITTSGGMVFPRGASNVQKRTPHLTSARGVTLQGARGNIHSTVKPTDLMRYLCRLVTPPGGVVLDPFMGSGSTGKAAILEGFQFVGIEQEPEYLEIARARIVYVQPETGESCTTQAYAPAKPKRPDTGQLSLF